MTARTYASGSFGHTVQLDLHRPQCMAFESAMTCITAGREAAALIARHLPSEDWPGESEDDRRRIWKILAGRGLPTASTADLKILRAFLRDLRAVDGTPDQTTISTDLDEVMVIDDEDDELTDRGGERRTKVPGRRSEPIPLRRDPREPRRLSVEPPDGLIEALSTALDEVRRFRDTRRAMSLAGIGQELFLAT